MPRGTASVAFIRNRHHAPGGGGKGGGKVTSRNRRDITNAGPWLGPADRSGQSGVPGPFANAEQREVSGLPQPNKRLVLDIDPSEGGGGFFGRRFNVIRTSGTDKPCQRCLLHASGVNLEEMQRVAPAREKTLPRGLPRGWREGGSASAMQRASRSPLLTTHDRPRVIVLSCWSRAGIRKIHEAWCWLLSLLTGDGWGAGGDRRS